MAEKSKIISRERKIISDLQKVLSKDLERAEDRIADAYITIILQKVAAVAQMEGATDEGQVARALKAIELLQMIPEIPVGNEDREGMPTALSTLWSILIPAAFSFSSHRASFARALLTKRRLSQSEQKALKDTLRLKLDDRELHVQWNISGHLDLITRESEPIVVRAFLHAAASRLDDASLLVWVTD